VTGYQVRARDHEGNVHDERWTTDPGLAAGILDDLQADTHVAQAWIENADDTPFDPQMLPAVEKIRFAEQRIRQQHRVLDDDWLFWGQVADHLNETAHIPGLTDRRPRDVRAFNRAQTMATGYIRMSMKGRQL
jgi:hypothetical protein